MFCLLFFLILFFILSQASSLSFIVLLTLSFVFIMVHSCSYSNHGSLLSSLISLLFGVITVFVTTTSLLIFFISYEFSLFPVCSLIILYGYQPEKINSILYLLVYTVVCSAPFLFFAVTLSGSIRSAFAELGVHGVTLVCLSFLVKSPLYTLHSWLPKAHVEAPLVGSMLLAGVILKLGRYGLLLLAPSLGFSSSVFVYLSLLGGVICSLICSRHWDSKSLVAYSSVVHIGAVTLGSCSGLELGFFVASGILVGHSLLSPLLFVLAAALYSCSGSRNLFYGYKWPGPASLLLAFGLCSGLNFGLPPFLNFWVEVSLFRLLGRSWSFSLIPLVLVALFSYLYSILFYVLSCGGPSSRLATTNHLFYVFIPSLFFSLLLAGSCSVFLY